MKSDLNPAVNIVWLKRDLRMHDHAPFYHASQNDVPVLPLYIVEPDYWAQPFASPRHWHFIHDCLQELRTDCASLGQPLIVRQGECVQVLSDLSKQFTINNIFAHEESGNGWTFDRDKAVIAWCNKHTIQLHEYPTNGVVRRLKSRDSWSKIRNARMVDDVLPKPKSLPPIQHLDQGMLPDKSDPMFGPDLSSQVQTGGRRAGVETLKSFLQERAKEYIYRISAPGASEIHCSRLSPHFAWGTLSVREVVKASQKRRLGLTQEQQKNWNRNLNAFGSRLSWRCHFIQKIEDQPDIEFSCMHPAFEGMRESEHNQAFFDAWATGQTGYPFIDACMRNLIHEGWITFRMRAMLTSFASYHLWLDWRKTGHYLAQLFTDYEPGIHYSQLQMQSGVTGINTVRIYNPIKQSQEHDLHGNFIRKWIPELKNVSDQWIHEPWEMDLTMQQNTLCMMGTDYPFPIVDHATAVKSARAKISAVQKEAGFKKDAKAVYQKLGSRKRPVKRKPKKEDDNQLSLLL
jgi:deoxyribodipyrimidine photo-lyase